MDYIVLDMEWNQPWPGSPSSKKVLPVDIRGEIIQIGAVRVSEEQFVQDEFQIMVKPKYYRHLNRRVSKLTGIKEARLRDEGVPFPEAIEKFREWCGEDVVFLTWGFDDIGILRENLRLFGLDERFTEKWYNAQMIFNAQTDGSTSQKALEYDAALKSHENGFHGAELPGCIARKVFYDYADKREALAAMSGEENKCPVCGGRMLGSRWFSQPGHRYMDLAACPEHGKFLIRVRLSQQPDGLTRVSRLTYEATSEAAEAYARRAEKADPEETASRPRRRRRKRSAPREQSGKTENT